MKRHYHGILAVALYCSGVFAQGFVPTTHDGTKDSVTFFMPQKAEGDLLNTRINTAVTWVLGLDSDRAGMVKAFADHSKCNDYSGEWAGKMLEEMAWLWYYSKNAQLKTKLDTYVSQLIATQETDGYLGNWRADCPRYTGNWDIWNLKYMLGGLVNYHTFTNDNPALQAAKRLADWLLTKFNATGGKDAFINGKHSGRAPCSLLWSLVDLYRITGETKYRDFAVAIAGLSNIQSMITSILDVNRSFDGTKSYETFATLVGLVQLYRVTGTKTYLDVGESAWNKIYTKGLYPIGTFSNGEYNSQDYDLCYASGECASSIGESCVTYYWAHLNWELFRLTGKIKYAQEIERSIYNAVLGGQNPSSGLFAYFLSMNGTISYGGFYSGYTLSFSEPRVLGRAPWMAAGVYRGNPMVNLYLPGTYTLPVTVGNSTVSTSLRIAGDYPRTANATITLTPASSAQFTLRLRVPYWCRDFRATVGGQSFQASATVTPYPGANNGQFLDITRTWSAGDQVQITMDMSFQSSRYGYNQGSYTYAGKAYVTRGPQVLSINSGVSGSSLPSGWVGSQLFRANGARGGSSVTLTMVPYGDVGQNRATFTTVLDDLTITGGSTAEAAPTAPRTLSSSPLNRLAGSTIVAQVHGSYQLSVTDGQGRVVASFTGRNSSVHSLPLSRSLKRVYFVTLASGKHTVLRRLLTE